MAVAAELLAAQTAVARMIDASAMMRDSGVWTTAKAPSLATEDLRSHGAFIVAILPSGLVLGSHRYAIVPYGYYSYSPLSYDPLSLNPNDPAYGAVRCIAYFDGVWTGADASPNAFEAGLRSDSNDASPVPGQSPPVEPSSPGAFASDLGGPGIDDGGGPAKTAAYDEPAATVFCPSARQRKQLGLILANLTARRAAAGLCRREIDGESESPGRLASARQCEWRCGTHPDETPLAGFCPLSRPGNELEFALFNFDPQRAETEQVDATPLAGICSRWPEANALEFAPTRSDARRAGAMTWRIAFGGNSATAGLGETPRLCVRPREEPVGVAPSAGFCERSPQDDWPELGPGIVDRDRQALTCSIQEDGEGAGAALRETPRLCERRREPRALVAKEAEFCPNPRRTAVVRRDPLDFSSIRASVTAANICRRVACAILVFDTDDLPPENPSAMDDRFDLPAQTPREPGVVDLGLARPTLAAGNANGAGVWPSVVTETQKRYCPMGTTPLTYAQLYFQFASTPPAPEPSTWVLMLLAFLGLGGIGLRKRRRGGEMG